MASTAITLAKPSVGFVSSNPALLEYLTAPCGLNYKAKEHVIYSTLHYIYIKLFSGMEYKVYTQYLDMLKKCPQIISDELLEWEVGEEINDLSGGDVSADLVDKFIAEAVPCIVKYIECMSELDFRRFRIAASLSQSFSFDLLGSDSIVLKFSQDEVSKVMTGAINAKQPQPRLDLNSAGSDSTRNISNLHF